MIDRGSPVPLYHQLRELLAARIAAGEWQPGDMLPTEAQLRALYQVSRSTARQALRELELSGAIIRQQGKGTFVARRKLSHSPEPRFGLTDVLKQQGIEPGWRVLSAEWTPAPAGLAGEFGLDPGVPLFRLRRLRLANDEPIGYHIAIVSPTAAAAIDRDRLDQGGSLDYLSGNGFLRETEAHRTIEAVLASGEIVSRLGVPSGSPILLIRRRVVSGEGELIERMNASYRGDRFQYQIRPRARAEKRSI